MIVALAVAAGIAVGFAVGKVPPAMAVISQDFGLDRVTAGWLASIFFAFGAGFGMLTGMVGGRVGARNLLLAGLLILGLASLVGAWASGGGMLLAMRVVEGIGFAAIGSAAPKLVFDAATPKDRDLALGIWSTYMPAGMAIAMILTSFLIEPLGWRGIWLISAGAALAVAFVAFVGTTRSRWPEQPRADPNAAFDWGGVRATLARGALWLYSVAFILFTVQWFAIAAWLPTFLTETQGRTAMTAALVSALVVATNVVGNLLGAWLLYRGAPRWSLLAGANLTMGVTGALILADFVPDAAKIPLAIIFSTGSGVLPAAAFSGAAVHAPKPDLIAMASGLLAQGAAIGMLLGPPLMAIVVGGLGSWENAWWCMLICPTVGLAIAFRILSMERGRSGGAA
jgi:MFS family permease